MLRAVLGPVPGKGGVLGGVLEAVPLSFAIQSTALLPALLPALLFFPALVPALLAALFRNSSAGPVSVANGFVTISFYNKAPWTGHLRAQRLKKF